MLVENIKKKIRCTLNDWVYFFLGFPTFKLVCDI